MPVLPSYGNQSIDLLYKSMTGFYMRATLAFDGLTELWSVKFTTTYFPLFIVVYFSSLFGD